MHACSPGGCSRSAIVAERTCRCFLHVQDQESRMCTGSVQLLRGHARLSSDSESVKVTTAEAPDPSKGLSQAWRQYLGFRTRGPEYAAEVSSWSRDAGLWVSQGHRCGGSWSILELTQIRRLSGIQDVQQKSPGILFGHTRLDCEWGIIWNLGCLNKLGDRIQDQEFRMFRPVNNVRAVFTWLLRTTVSELNTLN